MMRRATSAAALLATLAALASGCDDEVGSLVRAVDEERYREDLLAIARVRGHGSPGWQATQDLCADRLADLGFVVELHDFGEGVNVIGTLEGETDEVVLVGAHYDAVSGCPGADDNASGVAGVLEAARVLSSGRFERTLVVACWDQEEAWLVGSSAYTERESSRGTSLVAVLNLEMIGYRSDSVGSQALPPDYDLIFPEQLAIMEANDFRGDFILLAADEQSTAMSASFERHAATIGLKVSALSIPDALLLSLPTSDLGRSDHAPFWRQGYPGIMVSDTGPFRNPNYHCVGGVDSVDTIDVAFATNVVRASVGALADQLGFIRKREP